MSDVECQCVQKRYKISDSQNSLEDLYTQTPLWLSVLLHLVVLLHCWLPVVAKAGHGEERRGGQEKLKSSANAFSYLLPDMPLFVTTDLSNSFPRQT